MPLPRPADFAENPQYAFERIFLAQVHAQIGDRILLLTIDEFEELEDRVKTGNLPREIFPALRHLIQHEEGLSFIFAGKHEIEELVADYWSVLFNLAKYHRFGPLERESAIQLITEPVQPYGMVYDELAIEEVLNLTGRHPYFIQMLCDTLVERCNESHRNYVNALDVRDALDELVEKGRAHLLEYLWRESDARAKLVLAALAELLERTEHVTTPMISSVLARHQLRVDPGQVGNIMEELTARGITDVASTRRTSAWN